MPGVEPPEPTRLGEVVWLEPFPDALLELKYVHEMLGGLLHGGLALRQRQATAQVGPSAARVDERAHTDASVDIASGRGCRFLPGDLAE